MENTFTKIYSKNIWGSSGTGSKFTHDNKWFLKELKRHMDEYNLKTIGDIGCGDFEIMSHYELEAGQTYTGLDCVEFLMNDLNTKNIDKNIKFIYQDISNIIPIGYDIIILKDVIQHWTDEDIDLFLPKLLANNKYVYCVNGFKFGRDPTKNNWIKRELDKKYNYHPISIEKAPLDKYKNKIIDIEHRRCKQYILFGNSTK